MNKTIIGALVAIVVVGGGSFYAGMSYAKGQAPQRGQFGNGQFAGRGMGIGRGGMGFVAGQIISTANGSITIQSAASSSTQIVLFSNTTPIYKTAQGSASNLSTGTNVVITGTPNSDGSLSASSIQIRPAGMPGNFGGYRTQQSQ